MLRQIAGTALSWSSASNHATRMVASPHVRHNHSAEPFPSVIWEYRNLANYVADIGAMVSNMYSVPIVSEPPVATANRAVNYRSNSDVCQSSLPHWRTNPSRKEALRKVTESLFGIRASQIGKRLIIRHLRQTR